MSHELTGLQFPLQPQTQKASSSKTGREIISAALKAVDQTSAEAAHQEKNWRKQYPKHFKALVEHGIPSPKAALKIAEAGLAQVYESFDFYRDGYKLSVNDMLQMHSQPLNTYRLQGSLEIEPTWYVPYRGEKLQGQALFNQIDLWETKGIIEPSHAEALRECAVHPEWFDLSDRTMVLFGAASEAGPLTWLAQWKANIVALDLPNERVWNKILNAILQGNATLYAPSLTAIDPHASIRQLSETLGANLLTHTPEIAQWLLQFKQDLDLAAIAYLDGEKHVRVSVAMDSVMQYVSRHKSNTSLMYMCTPTDVYAVPNEILDAAEDKSLARSKLHRALSQGIATVSAQHFFQAPTFKRIESGDRTYGVCDCLVVEQGPNYALAKRIQQWRATLARANGQRVSINIAPSTTTHSVTKNPLLKAAFNGARLFDVEAFAPETTNALMAALWIYDLRHSRSVANPEVKLNHPLDLMMSGANHGGLWRVAYLARTALPFAALYGFAEDKLPKSLMNKLTK